MATKVVVCPACETPLVPGRFSCSSCGALVAAVASYSRSFTGPDQAVPPILEPAVMPAERNGHDAADAEGNVGVIDGEDESDEQFEEESALESEAIDASDAADDVVWGEPDPAPVAASVYHPYAAPP